MMEEFEWDRAKAQSNFAKHGVSFEAVRLVFDDVFALEHFDYAGDPTEPRYIISGMANGVILTVVYTERGNRIRIISARKPRPMSKENIIIARRETDGTLVQVLPDGSTQPLKDDTDWKRLREMAEDEVQAAALADPDAQPLANADFARMKRVARVRTLRRALHLTQEEFASRYHIPHGSLRDWEEGRCEPDQLARAYLRVIASDPEGVKCALEGAPMDGQIARYEHDNVSGIQKRVADIAIIISVVRNIGFKGALAVARDFVAHHDPSEFAEVSDERAFVDLLNKKTDELQLRIQDERAKQTHARSVEARLWG
jgi:putative transcriptional regulator